jgi:pimeloyl-ACP methyl ester carboxylesterase
MGGMRESIFEVSGPDGLVRRGVLTVPDESGTVAVILAPAGLKYHIGPHRMNVKLARSLAGKGYVVLRFDPLGLGESDGEIAPAATRDIWRTVENGRFTDDLLLMCRALRERLGVTRIVAAGLCGGAITSQLAAARAPREIQGVISIGAAVTLSAVEDGRAVAVSESVARHHLRAYLRKLLSKDAWLRILRGESDHAAIRRTLSANLGRLFRRRGSIPGFPNENPLFMESFRALQRAGTRHLLLFGSNDNRWLEFEAGVLKPRLHDAREGDGYEIALVPEANHELHLGVWQNRTERLITQWLGRHFPVAAAAGARSVA